jgi:hypothetical protein
VQDSAHDLLESFSQTFALSTMRTQQSAKASCVLSRRRRHRRLRPPYQEDCIAEQRVA